MDKPNGPYFKDQKLGMCGQHYFPDIQVISENAETGERIARCIYCGEIKMKGALIEKTVHYRIYSEEDRERARINLRKGLEVKIIEITEESEEGE